MSGGVVSMLSMANRTYLYAQKDNEFTGIGEFRYDAPFLALLFTHIDTVAIPSILFDLGDIKVGAFRGRLETTQVTDFLTKLRALFDVHRSKILPKIWEAIEPSFAEITETIDRITAGGYTHVLMDPWSGFFSSPEATRRSWTKSIGLKANWTTATPTGG